MTLGYQTDDAALSGMRVVDMASLYAAPLAATLLGDFGAEVIKVEPPGGDSFRGTTMWPIVARNKQSLVLDLRQPEDASLLLQLLATADVVVENLPPHTRASRGLDHQTMLTSNPRLIIVSVSCYGAHGPYAGRPGAGTTGEAFGGLTALTGAAEGPPFLPSLPLGDAITAVTAAFGAVAACYHRDTKGAAGQIIDVSMFEPVLQLLGPVIAGWRPESASPQRTGNRLRGSAVLRNLYATGDGGWLAVVCSTPRQQRDLATIVGSSPHETPSPDIDQLDRAVAGWVAARTRATAWDELTAARIGVSPVNDLADLLSDPHVRARASIIEHPHAELGPLFLPAPAPRLSRSPARASATTPTLGEHTYALRRELKPRTKSAVETR